MGTQISFSIGLDSVALLLAIVAGLAALWKLAKSYIIFWKSQGHVSIRNPERLGRPLFGRAQELSAIVEQLDSGRTVVVLGVAGIGKSTLGKAVAKILDQPCKRLVWVECKANTDLRSFVDAFASHVKTVYGETALREAFDKNEAHDATQWVDLLTGYLSRHHYVFFVDDLHEIKDQVILSELLPRLCIAANTLIMTRALDANAGAAIEQVSRLAETRLQGLSDADAVELLREKGLRQEAEEELLRLAQRVGGHPKALEICAGLVRDIGSRVTVTQLATGPLLGKHRDDILEQTVRLSDHRLSREERLMMVACAAFFESFTREAILAVFKRTNGAKVLVRLESRCLVDVGDQGMLSLHPLVQEYYEGLGRRTYRGGLFPALVVSVRFSDRLHRWLVYFSPLNLTPMCLLVRFRFRIAKYLQTLGTESLQARQSVVRYLVEALALDEIVEMEKSQYRVCKHPFTLPLHAPVAAFFTAGFVGLLNLVLLMLRGTGWQWIAWLMGQRLLASMLLAAVCVVIWAWMEIRSFRRSYVVVTADRSLCMKNLGGEIFFVESGLSWIAVPTPFFFNGLFGCYDNPGEHVLLDSRRIRFRGRELGRLLLFRKQNLRKDTPLHISFGFIAQPEAQYQALLQALAPTTQAAEQAQPIRPVESQGNEAAAETEEPR